MTGNAGYQDAVLPVWREFTSGKSGEAKTRAQIGASWRRCRQTGVDPYDNSTHPTLDSQKLQALLEARQALLQIAKPIMANLYEVVKGSGFVVVLTDERGYIMEMFGDEDTLRNPLTNNFFLGASWREEEAGTNAIGTALVIKEPIQVSGAEHYCQKHHCLTCSSAPIFDQAGALIGILDMSGASQAAHQHTLGMVVAAAEAIMALMAIRQKNRELAVINKHLTNIFNTMSDGVLVLDAAGIIQQVNPAAQRFLDRSEAEVLGLPIERIFGGKSPLTRRMLASGEPYEDVELMGDTNKKMCHWLVSGEPVTDGQGSVSGGVLIIRPIKQIQELVTRFSGYHATLQFSDIVGESVEIFDAVRIAKLAASTNSNILLQGESGTGKEIFAQAIHNRSERRTGPFLAVNCGVIPRELIGSELFGYVEGAFTGAKKGGKPGKFELASGGTLLLDEIGDMPLEQQVALLRVLQEKRVTRIGSDKVIPVNVRVICATNKNLLHEVERGAFRQDLYYRLNVISITIPPLRNRRKDIPLLFRHFLDKIARDRGCKFYVEAAVLECLEQYDWPGNVRELQNVVERSVSLAEANIVTMAHLPVEIYRPVAKAPLVTDLSAQPPQIAQGRNQWRRMAGEAERQQIIAELSRCGGNVSLAAREMGISRNTLYRKLRLYTIDN